MDQRQLQIVLKLQDEASRELRNLSSELDTAEKGTTRWGGALQYVATAAKAAAVAAGAAAVAGLTYGIKVAAQLETAQVGLMTLLGSSEKAAETMERMKKEAARTPFELPGLSQAVQLLTSVTKDGNKSIDIILDIGEGLAAMGKGQSELDRIIVNLQQIAATGRAALIDVRQFAFAGIPIYEMLTEQTGLAGEALADFIAEGGVTFDLLTEMFDKANDSGGRFFNAYVNNAGTFNQSMSNMKDAIGIFFADIVTGTGIFGGLTDAMTYASTWLLNYKENLSNMMTTVKEWIQLLDENTGLVTLLSEVWQNLVFMFNDQLKPALLELWETLKPYQPYLEALGQVLGFILVTAIGALIIIVGGLAAGLIQLLTWVTKVADAFLNWLKPSLDAVGTTILAVTDWVTNLIAKFKEAWEWAGKVASKAGSFVGNAVTSVGNAILPGRASGGPVTAGMPYIVGEQGPELFVPRGSGSIIPNGAGGMSVNVVVNGDVSGRELVERVQEAIMQGLRMNTKLAV